MKNIIIAFDGSQNALNAVNEAKKISKGFPDVDFTVVEVVDLAKLRDQVLDQSRTAKERNEGRVDEITKQIDGILENYSINVLFGDPATEIIKHIKESKYDLLIMGCRGLNLLQEFVMGSVSHKLAKYSPIPVLIVK